MKRLADSTLLRLPKAELLAHLRCAEHNEETMERQLKQQAENVKDWVPVVRCRECERYRKELGWCDIHSHFVLSDGEFCHPHESSDWKMFDENYFCGDGKRRNTKQERGTA